MELGRDDHRAGEGEEAPPAELATTLARALAAELGAGLRGVVGHGSWVHGDFVPGRSDLDLLVVLRDEPADELVPRSEPVLEKVVEAHPQWGDRIELGFVTREAVEDVLANAGVPHRAARVSPGEPLHFVDAERQQVPDWEAASRGVSVYGAGPRELLHTIPTDIVCAVVREHLRWWRSQGVDVTKAARSGYRSYVVLTVSRAAAFLSTGERLSKRQAGRWATAAYPPVAFPDRLGGDMVVPGWIRGRVTAARRPRTRAIRGGPLGRLGGRRDPGTE